MMAVGVGEGDGVGVGEGEGVGVEFTPPPPPHAANAMQKIRVRDVLRRVICSIPAISDFTLARQN